MRRPVVLAPLTLAVFLTACSSAPRPLVAGTDACDFCRMTVSDVRYGAEVQSRTGRVFTFDAVECMASFYLDASERDEVRGAWVTDFHTSTFVPADSAFFLEGSSIRSPMGRSLVAFAPSGSTADVLQQFGGRALRWPDVLARMRAQRLTPGAVAPPAHDSAARAPEGRTPGGDR